MSHRETPPCRFAIVLRAAVIVLFSLISTAPAGAQLLPGTAATTAKTETADGLEKLVEDARKAGSTVIIVRPKAPEAAAAVPGETNANRFLRARAAVAAIFATLPDLPRAAAATVRQASPDGSSWWLVRALVTALAGLLLGHLVILRISRWSREHFRHMYVENPRTAADKYRYLLFRVLLTLVYATIFFFMAIAVAVVADSGHEPTRRLIFEIILAYVLYRLLRNAVSWNLFAHDVPSHRLVNLTDEEAARAHRGWHIAAAIALVVAVPVRFLTITAEEQRAAGLSGGLDETQGKLLLILFAAFVVGCVFVYTLANWRGWQHAFGPPRVDRVHHRVWRTAANLLPVAWLGYSVVAFGVFVLRTALGEPAPGIVIVAPYLALWAAIVAYGIVLMLIQLYYRRREREFLARRDAELDRLAAEEGALAQGEEMRRAPTAVQFEYQPAFRSFFEQGALAIIVVIALGELGRAWGVPVGAENNPWASLLDIALAAILGWLAYRAIGAFIDRRLEEEGGVPVSEEEPGGEGGGAGASRMATLLPIFRYVMIVTVIAIAIMVILSELGFDIAPIFAGAGVIGIAVGFGAQKLIQDVFSGAFFLVDDAFRKGEYVEIEGIKGVVEKISIRSFQLRHHLGALHTIPFGEIRQLTNYSRDWVLMKLPLRVTYDTDVEKVRKLVKKLGQQLLEHPQVGHTFMQPLKSQGVYKMEDSAMIIRVKFMTRPGEQFVTRKVVYESIQDLFAREGIKFAHKEVTVRLAEDGRRAEDLDEEERRAVTAAARSVIDAEEATQPAAADADAGR